MSGDKTPDDLTSPREIKTIHQRGTETQSHSLHMESSMTESMEESSTVESARHIKADITSVIQESDLEHREEVVLRKKKSHIDEFKNF